jgi:hypothetical protein
MFPRSEGPWLTLLHRHCPPDAPPCWDDVVVGHDFGLLPAAEIQRWTAAQEPLGEAGLALAALEGAALERFERALWNAAAEATGKTPRPGGKRWARAQDRWRLALLRDALEAPVSAEALAVLVETIYETVGCPEDMLGLWRRPCGPGQGRAESDRAKVAAFIERREKDLVL